MDTGKGFGFRFVSNGSAPTITPQKPAESISRVKKGDGILFEGKVTVEDGAPLLTILRQGEDDEGEVEIWRQQKVESEGVENDKGFYDFEYSHYVEETWFNQAKSQQYRLILRATNGRATEDEKTVLYDVDGPEISITEVKPVVELNGKNNINKKFSVKGSITDKFDNVGSANWTLKTKPNAAGESKVIASSLEDLKTTFTFEADTGDYDKIDAILTINAYDKAGNKTTETFDYYIDQSTDIPTIQPNDPDTLTFSYKSKQALVDANNAITDDKETRKNFYTANSQVIMKFTDDDGINTITVSATVDGQSQAATSSTVQAKNATEYTYAYKAPESEGYYRIDVTVMDKENTKKEEYFYILVSGETPSLKLTTSPEYITTNTESLAPNAKTAFTIIGVNSGSAPFKKVIRYEDGEDEEAGTELAVAKFTESATGKNDASDKKRWVDTYVPESDDPTGRIKYVLYDAYGITAQENFDYKVDSVRPVAKITSCLDKDTSGSGNFRFVGIASDKVDGSFDEEAENGSGVARVYIRIDNYDEDAGDEIAANWNSIATAGTNSTGWIEANGTDNWNAQIVFTEYPRVFGKEGQKVLYVRVEDAVGNYNVMSMYDNTTKIGSTKVFVFDTEDPEVSIDKYTGDEERNLVAVNGKKSFEISQNFSLDGTMSDEYGIDNIVVEQTFGTETVVIPGVDSNEESNGNWSWFVDNLPRDMDTPSSGQSTIESGKYTYKVTVTDKAGKTSSESVTVTVDITPPTIEITKPVGNITNANGSKTYNFISGDSYMFQGTVVDNAEGTGVDTYYYFLSSDGTVPDDTSNWTSGTSDVDWSFAKTIANGPVKITGSDLYEGEWVLYVKAVDKAGNVSNVVSREFSIDKAAPRLTVDSTRLRETGTTYFKDASYSINGTVIDTHGIDSIVIRDGTTTLVTIDEDDLVAGTEQGSYTWTAQLSIDENTNKSLTIIAKDKTEAGRESDSITRSVYRDTQAPNVWITSDLSGLIESVTGGVAIQGSVNDGTGCGVDKVLYSIDGSEPSLEATITDQNWSINLTSANLPSEGMYTLNLKAVDKLGTKNTAPVTGTLAYDIAKPTLTVNLNDGTSRSVTNNSQFIVSADTYAISGNFSDSGTNVTVTASVNCSDGTAATAITQNPAVAKSGTWTLAQTRRVSTQTQPLTDIPDDIYEYTINAVDAAGIHTGSSARKETIKFKVTKDTTAPSISSVAIPDKETTKITQFTFSGVTEDATSGIASVKLTITDASNNSVVFSTDATNANLKISGLERWSREVVYANYPVFNTEGISF